MTDLVEKLNYELVELLIELQSSEKGAVKRVSEFHSLTANMYRITISTPHSSRTSSSSRITANKYAEPCREPSF